MSLPVSEKKSAFFFINIYQRHGKYKRIPLKQSLKKLKTKIEAVVLHSLSAIIFINCIPVKKMRRWKS
jgi:hypothetical protein